MIGNLYRHLFSPITITIAIAIISSAVTAEEQWQSGFDDSANTNKIDTVKLGNNSALTLEEILKLVGAHNPTLRSLKYKREYAYQRLVQANKGINPEFSAEFEDIGWDVPGFSEAEIFVSLSKEFQLSGQKEARKQIAKADINSTEFETKLEAFDLYLETKSRFNKLMYSQRQKELADSSVVLAESIVTSIKYKMKQGAALQSELLLAQLEYGRSQLTNNEAQQELKSSQIKLASLWNSTLSNIYITAPEEPELKIAIDKLHTLLVDPYTSRGVERLHFRNNRIKAEKKYASVETSPTLKLSGGFKRNEFDNSNSFLFGISIPLPISNRNQGKKASLEAALLANEYQQQREKIEANSNLNSAILRVNQLIEQHMFLDTLLLPTAENIYKTFVETYNVGRIPYTTLLEAERSLIGLRFEHNDVLFSIYQQLILIERISGLRMY